MDKKQYIYGNVKNNDGTISVVASDESLDRHGEVVRASGWDLGNFKKNPVMLTSHNYDELPVGKWNVNIEGKRLIANPSFASTTRGKEVKTLVDEGMLNAVSVGFIAKERDQKDTDVITQAELLEISWVSIPANPNALRRALSKGITPVVNKELLEEVKKESALYEEYKAKIKGYRKLLKTLQKLHEVEIEGEVTEEKQIEHILILVTKAQGEQNPGSEVAETEDVSEEASQETPEVEESELETPEFDEEVAKMVQEEVRKVLSKFI